MVLFNIRNTPEVWHIPPGTPCIRRAILQILLDESPVWFEAPKKECNKKNYNRVQRIINIKLYKAFRTTSSEALCTLTGLNPVVIKSEESVKLYNIMRYRQAYEIDHEVQPNEWLQTADTAKITEQL